MILSAKLFGADSRRTGGYTVTWNHKLHLDSPVTRQMSCRAVTRLRRSWVPANNPSQPRATHSDMTSLPGRLLRLRTKQARCFIVFSGSRNRSTDLMDHIGGRPLWFSKSGTSWRGWCCIMVHRNIFPSFSYPADLKWLEPHMYILCELGILKLLCKGRFGWGFKVHPTSKHMIIFTCMS